MDVLRTFLVKKTYVENKTKRSNLRSKRVVFMKSCIFSQKEKKVLSK